MKTNKHILNFFYHRVAKPFYFFHAKRDGDIPTETPLTGASNAGGVGKKRCIQVSSTVWSTYESRNVKNKAATDGVEPSTHGGVRRLLLAQDDDEVFVTGSTLYGGEEVKFPPDTTPLVITPVFCCRRTS